jgi:hypothetical protein
VYGHLDRDADGYVHSIGDVYLHVHPHGDSQPDRDRYPNRHGHLHVYAHLDRDADGYVHSIGHFNLHVHSHSHA